MTLFVDVHQSWLDSFPIALRPPWTKQSYNTTFSVESCRYSNSLYIEYSIYFIIINYLPQKTIAETDYNFASSKVGPNHLTASQKDLQETFPNSLHKKLNDVLSLPVVNPSHANRKTLLFSIVQFSRVRREQETITQPLHVHFNYIPYHSNLRTCINESIKPIKPNFSCNCKSFPSITIFSLTNALDWVENTLEIRAERCHGTRKISIPWIHRSNSPRDFKSTNYKTTF